MTLCCKLAAAAFAVFLGSIGSAQATSFNLGNVSGPGQFSIGNDKWVGPFTDKVHFTIDPGVTLFFSAFVSTGFARRAHILDLDGTLSDASGVILEGDALTVSPQGFPERQIGFPTILLGPGHYYLSLFGSVTSTDPGPGRRAYAGTLTFAATPLPDSWLLLLTALGGFGLLVLRRTGQAVG